MLLIVGDGVFFQIRVRKFLCQIFYFFQSQHFQSQHLNLKLKVANHCDSTSLIPSLKHPGYARYGHSASGMRMPWPVLTVAPAPQGRQTASVEAGTGA